MSRAAFSRPFRRGFTLIELMVSTALMVVIVLVVVSIAAVIGGRLYHVIDQWALYADDRWWVREAAKTYPWTIKSRNDRRVRHLTITSYDPAEAEAAAPD